MKPMTMYLLPETFYALRSDESPIPEKQRVLHPKAARIFMDMQDDLVDRAAASWDPDKPIVTLTTMTRDNAYQYYLVRKNAPRNIPTATVGKSLHAYGMAIDVNTRDTMRRINAARIDMSFEELRKYLAGYGIMGISSERWHFNIYPGKEWFTKHEAWRMRDVLYEENWTDLSDAQKEANLDKVGAEGDSLRDKARNFQQRYSESLAVDGIPGNNTMRAVYVEWAHQNFVYAQYAE